MNSIVLFERSLAFKKTGHGSEEHSALYNPKKPNENNLHMKVLYSKRILNFYSKMNTKVIKIS